VAAHTGCKQQGFVQDRGFLPSDTHVDSFRKDGRLLTWPAWYCLDPCHSPQPGCLGLQRPKVLVWKLPASCFQVACGFPVCRLPDPIPTLLPLPQDTCLEVERFILNTCLMQREERSWQPMFKICSPSQTFDANCPPIEVFCHFRQWLAVNFGSV
jgi:hypothetical protein